MDPKTLRALVPLSRVAALTVAALTVAACEVASERDDSDSPDSAGLGPAPTGEGSVWVGFVEGEVEYAYYCAETDRSQCSRACDRCWDAVTVETYVPGVSFCDASCDCYDFSNECARFEHAIGRATIDDALFEACSDAADAGTAVSIEEPGCPTSAWDEVECYAFAGAEAPAAMDYYLCLGEARSLGLCDPDLCAVPQGDSFGTDLAAVTRERCGDSTIDPVWADENSGFWREDTKAAAYRCLELPTCTLIEGCHRAWLTFVGVP